MRLREQAAAAVRRGHAAVGSDRLLHGADALLGRHRESRGRSQKRLSHRDDGRREGDGLTITQDFTFEDGRRQQRIWQLKRVDAHRYDATASDVIGGATGYAWGNTFCWEYTLQLKAGNPLSRVHMKHCMYLTDDGDLLINRVIMSKFGVSVAQTTEYFRRGAGDIVTIGESR